MAKPTPISEVITSKDGLRAIQWHRAGTDPAVFKIAVRENAETDQWKKDTVVIHPTAGTGYKAVFAWAYKHVVLLTVPADHDYEMMMKRAAEIFLAGKLPEFVQLKPP